MSASSHRRRRRLEQARWFEASFEINAQQSYAASKEESRKEKAEGDYWKAEGDYWKAEGDHWTA
jgi:hypothetical protein